MDERPSGCFAERRHYGDAKIKQYNRRMQDIAAAEAEEDAKKMYPDYRSQVSFDKDGNEVKYGTKGSVRPDLYKSGSSVEVKNYLIETKSQSKQLVKNVVTQYNQKVDTQEDRMCQKTI